MRIESIDIVGFKSFADKTTLKFGRGLTAVVGPNGSGKSNVSDAVRWVLGEQSTKSLRGTSMEDVIFSGTAKRKPHGFCEVTIHFDNSDRGLNFNEDKVSVTRRYYRSHESEYAINGVSVRLKDVHELFMDTGLGRDGYSMIGQGKIDNIVSTKSNERRDIFEEASGISRYRYRKIDAERRLTAAEENLLRLRDILEELRSRVGPLKEQSEKAEKFLVLAAEKKNLEIGLWLRMLEDSKEAFRKQESKIAVATEQYRQIESQLTDFDNTIEKNSADLVNISMIVDELKLGIATLEEQIARTEGEINLAKANILHNNENIARYNDEKNKLALSDESAVAEKAKKQAEITDLENKAAEIKSQADTISEKLSTLIQSSESISRQLESKAMELN
ncbi:MAG: AAA family ATPase [Clostridia bacterium]|nr:AAA family ATPase [Clostridia bacterium]